MSHRGGIGWRGGDGPDPSDDWPLLPYVAVLVIICIVVGFVWILKILAA